MCAIGVSKFIPKNARNCTHDPGDNRCNGECLQQLVGILRDPTGIKFEASNDRIASAGHVIFDTFENTIGLNQKRLVGRRDVRKEVGSNETVNHITLVAQAGS